MNALQFKNFSEEDFTHSFDSIPYTFKAGQAIMIEDFKAKLFAKHLIDRELTRKNIPTDNKVEREAMERLCFAFPEVKEDLVEKLETEAKAKKSKGKGKKVELEEEFSDL